MIRLEMHTQIITKYLTDGKKVLYATNDEWNGYELVYNFRELMNTIIHEKRFIEYKNGATLRYECANDRLCGVRAELLIIDTKDVGWQQIIHFSSCLNRKDGMMILYKDLKDWTDMEKLYTKKFNDYNE